jgi:hypothetical protein
MALIPLSDGPVVKGTMFWAPNEEMERRSQTGSQIIRPHLVMNIIDGTALCCPMSRSSDAWNAEVSPHFVPCEVNRSFLNKRDSLYAVDAWHRDGLARFSVDFIESGKRIDLPLPFVQMGNDLYMAFSQDVRLKRLPKVAHSKYKNRRLRESIQRINLTTVDVMKEIFPSWSR